MNFRLGSDPVMGITPDSGRSQWLGRVESGRSPRYLSGVSDPEVITLWRPVGPVELRLIAESDYLAFPPRLPEQPIFYPVLNEEYATQIARDWNAKASGVGFVTRFQVSADFISAYTVQQAGGRQHLEYWIPAEDLPAFNAAIIGKIEVVAEFR